MNPDQLLKYFDCISETPDAIPRLREFILDLAIRGKLVEQDSQDEPASQLIKTIRQGVGRRSIGGDSRDHPSSWGIEEKSKPFPCPAGWAWTRLGSIIQLLSGQHLAPGEYSLNDADGIPYITGPADFGESGLIITRYALIRKAVARKDQLLLTVKGAGVGKTSLCNLDEVAISRQLMALAAINWNQNFLLIITHRLAEALKKSARSLIPGISRQDVENFVLALPPVAEQCRIVAKVDDLMALCDQFANAKERRDKRRENLVASSLHHLNKGVDSQVFRGHAGFYLSNLSTLTANVKQVYGLRQTILNLAVRGKLVSQNSDDEPASELLARVKRSRQQSTSEGLMRKQKELPKIDSSLLPFEVPIGWSWVRLGDLCRLVTSGSRDWAQYYSDEGAVFVRMGNLSRDSFQLRLGNIQRVKPPLATEGERTRLEANDLLISITGEVGMLGLIPSDFGEAYINQHTALARRMPELQKSTYLPMFFLSPIAKAQFDEPQRGIKNSFRLTDITHLLVPLPPLKEQDRITTRVDQLMAVCDELDAQTALAEKHRHRLLEAVLHAALQAGNPHELSPKTALSA